MTNKTWSYDGELFQYDSLYELIEDVNGCDGGDVSVGDIVYVGDAEIPSVKRYINVDNILESICESACDDVGECAEEWPDLSAKEKGMLEDLIADFLDKYSPVKFYTVSGVKEYVVTAEDLG